MGIYERDYMRQPGQRRVRPARPGVLARLRFWLWRVLGRGRGR